MAILPNIIIAGLTFFGVNKFLRLSQVSDNLTIEIEPAIKVNPTKFAEFFHFKVHILLKNSVNSSIEVTQPFVKLLAGEEEIASSTVSNKTFKINGLSQKKLDVVDFKIDLLTALNLITKLKYQFPAEFKAKNLLGKALWISQHANDILKSLEAKYEVSTYADGIFIKTSENIIE